MYLFIDMLLKAVLPPILLNKLTDYHSFKLLSLLDGEQLLPFLLSKFGGDAHLGILAGRFLWVRHVCVMDGILFILIVIQKLTSIYFKLIIFLFV